MALKIVEFFGHAPLDPAASEYISETVCPFIKNACTKPNHGACSVRQVTDVAPIICCPNRMYAGDFKILSDIAHEAFGAGTQLVKPTEIQERCLNKTIAGNEVAVFGRYWGQELPLPRPAGASSGEKRKFYVDWILARISKKGELTELTAVEVQTIDTIGNYSDQAKAFFAGETYVDKQGRQLGFSDAGMNWENVNKRILPQIIYKGHVLRREQKCSKGLFFVCPRHVYDRIRDRLGGHLHEYHPGNGTITFRSYELGPKVPMGRRRKLSFFGQFTTTVDQVALAFTAPMNLPDMNVYEAAINKALS